MRLIPGLYESFLTRELERLIAEIDPDLTRRSHLATAEAPDRIAFHMSRIIRRAVAALPEDRRLREGLKLAAELAACIDNLVTKVDARAEAPLEQVLSAILTRRVDGGVRDLESPLTPLLDTTLLTNAPDEPRISNQVLSEIDSADRIYITMAFIRRTGLRPLLDAFRRHCSNDRPLRILTTAYTGSTESAALEQLVDLGANVRVSYETGSTRLHAKSWLFHRSTGFSTAFIGSSNLTHSAMVTGAEWNVRVSGARNPEVIDKIRAVFDSYWNNPDFVVFDSKEFDERTRSEGPQVLISNIEVRPEPFQARLLEQIAVAREFGRHRNLLVSATGTGKTVMAALDYRDLRQALGRSRLLFVAHRREILEQSLATFRQVLRDANFGELWVDGRRPKDFQHVFASIQSLSATGYDELPVDHFDVVVIDEFHHAAAQSYQRLLGHVCPLELLGLTATPERADGLSVLDWFDNRIAAELRLWDAIEQRRLVPFLYYGIFDGLDLRQIPWRRGRGYDVEDLTKVYTANDIWARNVAAQYQQHVDNPAGARALGFCVSVDHARFMARQFATLGIPAQAVWADTPAAERDTALSELKAGRINVLFSVDLFNEGVDLPAVDCLLMLRPTDSPTLFLQQLGRGLRTSPGKVACTVLDFVGRHRTEFRFDRRLGAIFAGTRKELEQHVSQGFPFLPAGCHMELDQKASQIVLQSIRDAVPSQWAQRVREAERLARAIGRSPTLEEYLEETGLDLSDLYSNNKSWSDLCDQARLPIAAAGPAEQILRRACGRLIHIDDNTRIDAYIRFAEFRERPSVSSLSERDRRLLRMLVASLVDTDTQVDKKQPLQSACDHLWHHPQVLSELRDLLPVLRRRIDHVQPELDRPNWPLRVHARYTGIEILAAGGDGDAAKTPTWREGVRWLKGETTDLLRFTLDKSSGSFSPTTRYRDYAIDRTKIHWESQSFTPEDSETGRRYRSHEQLGTRVYLFARLRNDDRAFWFLGPGRYVTHESEKPMQITWRLDHPLSGDLFASFAAAVA